MRWTVETLRAELRAELTTRMRARDREAVSTLRMAIAAIDNAESPAITAPEHRAGAVEASAPGVGTAEVSRLTLDHEQLLDLLRAEATSAPSDVLTRWV